MADPGTLAKGVGVLAASLALLARSAVLFRRRTRGSMMLLVAGGCMVVVALAHVCEALQILPSMGWGQPRSIGHYVDFGAAMLGIAFLLPGLLLNALGRRRT